jgi:hypothetical protein
MKAIYINGALFSGLAIEWYRGRPLLAIGITAVLLFTVANSILIIRKKADRSQ